MDGLKAAEKKSVMTASVPSALSSADVAVLSRIQFALTVAYHFLFVPLSIGLGLILAINETRYYRSRKLEDAAATKFGRNRIRSHS